MHIGLSQILTAKRLDLTLFTLTLSLAAVSPALAQRCSLEQEPNDTSATATPLSATCFEGTLPGTDQDAFTWEVSEEESFIRWQMRVEGIAGQLTKVDLIRVTFADNGTDVTAAETLFTFGTRDGSEAVSDPFLIPPGAYTLGVSKSGGEGAYRVALEPVQTLLDTHALEGLEPQGAFALLGSLEGGEDALEWRMVNLSARRLQVTGKGGYVDSVSLSSSLVEALDTLQSDTTVRRKGKARAGKVLPYGDERLRQRLKTLCGAAGVPYRALHALRHASGTRMYEETNDLRRTQTHLRHKNLATTTVYAKVADRAVADVTREW